MKVCRLIQALLLFVVAGLLVACGSGDDSTYSSSGTVVIRVNSNQN